MAAPRDGVDRADRAAPSGRCAPSAGRPIGMSLQLGRARPAEGGGEGARRPRRPATQIPREARQDRTDAAFPARRGRPYARPRADERARIAPSRSRAQPELAARSRNARRRHARARPPCRSYMQILPRRRARGERPGEARHRSAAPRSTRALRPFGARAARALLSSRDGAGSSTLRKESEGAVTRAAERVQAGKLASSVAGAETATRAIRAGSASDRSSRPSGGV